jgi:hypothetical protein
MSEDLQFALAAQEAFSQPDKTDAGQVVLEALGPRLLMEFAEAERAKRPTEERFLKDLRQFKGMYDPEVLAKIGPKRSKTFVRKTRVKIKTLDARVEDLLFPMGTTKNWNIKETPIPSVPKEVRKTVTEMLTKMLLSQAAQAQQPGQPQLPAKPPQPSKEQIDAALLEICKQAAKKMAKVIEDQLAEIKYKKVCKEVAHSGHLFGTGILKGPLVEKRVRSTFVHENGKWVEKSEEYIVPFIDFVPVWRFYPDMGSNELSKCRYTYERHHMTHADMAELATRKTFNSAKIIEYIKSHPNGEVTPRYIDNELKIIGDRTANQGGTDGKYEVLERWGWVTGQDLKNCGLKIAPERIYESFFSNIWLLPNGTIIKAVLQPINGVTWPYHLYYFDKDETSIFAEGLATVMRDDQTNINAAHRLILDNGAITAGVMVELATQLLSNMEQGTEIEPWKVFLRNATNPTQTAVRVIDIPSKLDELSGIADRFEDNCDEVSALPRYMTGENVNSGAAGTSSGMSMLMGAVNIMVKDQIGNWDDGITESFFHGLYRWNMQFNPDQGIKGDFDVQATGSASLVAREVRAQQLDQFSAMVANPMDAPFIKRANLLRQRAEAHELSDVVKTEDEVAAETNNELAQAQQKLTQAQAQLVLAELEKKVALLTSQAEKASAEVQLILSKVTESKVASVFAALQAGGVATQSPHIAPAGDEILRSSGWQDATPQPAIGDLMQPSVQGNPDQDPVNMAQMPENTDPMAPATGNVQAMPSPAAAPVAEPQTGRVGVHAGIETPAIE